MTSVKCPYCRDFCDADFVDVGVGYVQCGPYHCQACGASEIGPYDEYVDPHRRRFLLDDRDLNKGRVLTKRESETGWYAPESTPGTSANVIHGKVVSHNQMLDTYRDEFVGNPLYHSKAYVDQWYENIRK